MTGRNANIYFPEETYNKLKQVAGVKISRFVSEAVEEKIKREQQQKEEEFRKKLIAGYKRVAKNKKIQKEFDKLKEFSKPYRPCLVVSNDTQNEFDENIVVVGLTTDDIKNIEPFEVFIENALETGLKEPSKICCNYLHTINKKLRLVDKKCLGAVSPEIMKKVKKALKIVLNLD
ncbi:14108_t:CDS:2 [Funneliformis geosporum]|nr:14108_t:CDS:2 [Funneliformis geosporum]